MKRFSCLSIRRARALAMSVLVTPIVAAVAFPSTALGLLVATTPPGTDAPPPVTVTTPGTIPSSVPSGGNGDGISWGPIVIGILLVVVAIAVIAAVMSRRTPARSAPAPAPRPAPAPAPAAPPSAESQTLSTAQWIHDQLSLEVLAAEPAAATTRWNAERTRLDGVAITAQQFWAAGRGDTWQSLAQTMSALASAIDTNVNLRAQAEVDAALVHESVSVVNRQRAVLQQVVNALWPTVQR